MSRLNFADIPTLSVRDSTVRLGESGISRDRILLLLPGLESEKLLCF